MKKLNYLLIFLLIFFTSCETEMDKYYKLPDNLKGNSWEVLEAKGNFSIFLDAVSRTSFKDLVQGKGQITVMAPTDDAFKKFFASRKINSINDLSAEELEKIIAYHLVYYSFSKERFENYHPGGIEAELNTTQPGLYYKFRTKSRDQISTAVDLADNGNTKKIIHKDRFLPVFSYNLFSSKKIEAKRNYEYFYPNSVWQGDNGFNVSNATVNEYALVTDNGYVYTLNEVIEPLETIHKGLALESDYNNFKEIYDRFINFRYDAASTTAYGKGDSLYLHYHFVLPAIASEWTNDVTSATLDYAQLSSLSRNAMNVFAPTNAALTAFYDKYWKPYYGDAGIQKVNFTPLLALLTNHVSGGDLLFPETILAGNIKTTWGTPIVFDPYQVKLKKMCVNGALYGLDQALVPPMFEKVTSPMYCDPAYNMFLDMSGEYINILLSDENQFNVFYPSDNMISSFTTLGGSMIQFVNTNPNLFGSQEIQIEGLDGMERMKVTQKRSFAGNHITIKKMTSRGDEAIYRTLNPFNYIYLKGNQVYSSALYNAGMTPPAFKEIGTWSNGKGYALEGEASALVPETSQFKDIIASPASCPPEFTAFNWLIEASAAHKTVPPFNFLQGNRFIAFIPIQKVVEDDFLVGKIPWFPSSTVLNFLKYYFIDVNASNLLEYPFPGAGISGELTTFRRNANGEPSKLTLIDTGNGLQVKDSKGNVANVVSYFPKMYADGAAYLIDGILSAE